MEQRWSIYCHAHISAPCAYKALLQLSIKLAIIRRKYSMCIKYDTYLLIFIYCITMYYTLIFIYVLMMFYEF